MNSRIAGNLSSLTKAILICTAVVNTSSSAPAYAADRTGATGRDNARDMNLFQIEPTVIDERYYTSGRAERHQKTSPTLPYGAPIPDNDAAPVIEVKPTQTQVLPASEKKVQTSTTSQNPVQASAPASKLDASIQTELNALKSGEDKTFKLKLKCTASDDSVIKTLNQVKNLKVVSIDKAQNEITVEAQTSAVAQLSGLTAVTSISPVKAGQ
ncbi:MAG: hypothetical protein SGJ27_00530 [Candidatus Melainabacteria bacterium]|nr:hypothetical protein [Candidatus Melainabacteria bacterium]